MDPAARQAGCDAGGGPDRGVRRRARWGTLAATVATMAVLGLLLGVPVGPAGAHDALESTIPADDAVLQSPPSEVVLTFGADQLSMGTAVTVTGPDGDDHADGAPRVTGRVVTQAVGEAPAGDFTVRWRSVSADGHPVSGEFGFSVLGEEAAAGLDGGNAREAAPDPDSEPDTEVDRDAAVGSDATVGPDAPADGEPPAATVERAPDDRRQARTGGWPVLAATLVAALAVAGVVVARRRQGGPP